MKIRVSVWASSTSNTYMVSLIDESAGYDSDGNPRRELSRERFPCPIKPNGWPDLDAGYAAASQAAASLEQTLKLRPELIMRKLEKRGKA